MSDRLPMTRKGYDRILKDIRQMEDVEMPIIAQRIADARAEGDLKENAEYHGARESQGMLQAKINMLKGKLANSEIINVADLPKGEVVFGCTVKVKDLDFMDEEEFTLVGAGEEDYDAGKILANSPLAKGFLGKKVGEKVEVDVPAGKSRFEILAISHEE